MAKGCVVVRSLVTGRTYSEIPREVPRRHHPTCRPGRFSLITGLALIALGIVGAQCWFSTLPLAVVVSIVRLGVDVAARRPRVLRLIDVWCAAFVYLFGSEVLLAGQDVRADFGVRISTAAEGAIVAAFGASLVGYAVADWFGPRRAAQRDTGSRIHGSTHQLVLMGLSTVILLYIALFVPRSELLTMRVMRSEQRLLGAAAIALIPAMIVQCVLTGQVLAGARKSVLTAYPIGVALLSFAVLYINSTRYFLGFLAGGVLFFAARLTQSVSRRQVAILAGAVVALAAVQGTMRLVRGVGLGGTDAAAVTSSLVEANTYLSHEGLLRVNAWVHHKEVFWDENRALEHAFYLYWWVPRTLWPSKPTMGDYWLAHEVVADRNASAGHSVAGGFMLPALLDFGPNLGTVVCLFYGLALWWLERFMAAHGRPGDPLAVISALLPFAVFFAMRSPQTSMIFLQCCVAVYLPIFLVLRATARRVPAATGESAGGSAERHVATGWASCRQGAAWPVAQPRKVMSSVLGPPALIAIITCGVPTTTYAVPEGSAPGFAVELDSRGLRSYRPKYLGDGGAATVSNDMVEASVAHIQGHEWELRLSPRSGAVTAVWFPWESERAEMPDPAAGIVYYPRYLGVATRNDILREWNWQGGVYPGECYAPLVVVADDRDARMVAATNWPPRRVKPMYSLGRIGLRYDERLAVGEHRSYRAIAVATTRSAQARSWQRALDEYKRWLKPRLENARLKPTHLPWMGAVHGWLNVELQNTASWDVEQVEAVWARWKRHLPWVQFWGQMSAYHERDRRGAEETGCCLAVPEIHRRYQQLPELARRIAHDGRVGFYSRPRKPYAPLVSTAEGAESSDLGFLRAWLERNRSEYGANAFYIDVIGHRYFGDPLQLARLLKTGIDPATVIEYPVDIYPTAFLVSGSLGGGNWNGGPGRTGDPLGSLLPRTTFPSFGRYLFDDRLLFLGESNGDGRWWGPGADYWTERQAFLLGAKFDVMHPTEDGHPAGPENRALILAIAARDRSGWWDRAPLYMDGQGLGELPDGVDVRRYRGRSDETLLVVDNWNDRHGVVVNVDGTSVALPEERLAIVVLPRST